MALFIHFCTYVLFVLVSVLHAQELNEYCSVENPYPSIEENNDPGIVVANITTAVGVTVTIDLKSTVNPHWFEINGSQLILKHSVDYEDTTVLIVVLTCWSGGIEEDSLNIQVTIINVNDNPPVFKETNITVNVNEDTKVNTTVVPQANVTATDADGEVIFYNLTGSPTELEYFNIQGVNNPQISLLKPLDYETINLMEFTLYAMDGNADAKGTHTATAAITIHILQVDLRPPWFQPCTLFGGRRVCISYGYTGKVNISENVTEPLILEPGPLYAIDGDRDLNETIVYEIAGGNDYNTFSINKYTGNITMDKPANTLQTFMLYIVASQENNPFRYSQTTVEIKVVRRNDHRPDFNTTYMGTVSVDMPVSSLVMEAGRPSVPLKIFAADYDFPDGINPDIRYEIQNSSDFRVTLDGFLLTNVVLDVAFTITLLAIANDTVALQEARTLITVNVLPLAITTVPTTTTTTTTTTPTTPFPAIPGTGTTTLRPSGPSSSLPPGINSTLPTVASGSTQSTTPPASTTRNTGITGSTGKPVTVPGPGGTTQSTNPTYTSTVTSTNSASPGPGGPTPSTSPTSPSTVTSTTSASPGPGGSTQSTNPTSTSSVTSTTSASPGPGGPTPSTNPTSPSTVTSTTSASPGPGGSTLSTNPTSTSSVTSTTSAPPGSGGPTHSTRPTSASTVTSTASAAPGPVGPTLSTSPTSTSSVTSAASEPGEPTQSISPTSTSSVTSTTSENSAEVLTVPWNKYERDMAVLGGTLGSLLVITLVLLGLISYKYYKLKKGPREDNTKFVVGCTNTNFENDDTPNSDGNTNELPANLEAEVDNSGTPPPLEMAVESSLASAASEAIPSEDKNVDSEKEVRSILTKDRRMADDDGYKAVWFKEDIDPEAKDDILVIEDDSDGERDRNESDGDTNEEKDVDDSDNDHDGGRGSGDVSFIPGRAHLPEAQSTPSESLENTEENVVYL